MSAGSSRRLNIRGTDFDLISDTSIDKKGNINHERIATSGKSMRKITFQIAETGGIKIVYTKANVDLLENWISDGQESEIYFDDPDGETYYCTGTFRVDSTSTMDGEIAITIMPETNWK